MNDTSQTSRAGRAGLVGLAARALPVAVAAALLATHPRVTRARRAVANTTVRHCRPAAAGTPGARHG